MSKRLLIFALLIVLAFAFGFFPQYLERRALESQLNTCRAQSELAEVRYQAGLLFLETVRNNYGLAGESAGRYFNRLRELSEAADAARRPAFQDLLARRDAITAGLAKADPAVHAEVQALYQKTMETMRP